MECLLRFIKSLLNDWYNIFVYDITVQCIQNLLIKFTLSSRGYNDEFCINALPFTFSID